MDRNLPSPAAPLEPSGEDQSQAFASYDLERAAVASFTGAFQPTVFRLDGAGQRDAGTRL